jgi:hypothetical protein
MEEAEDFARKHELTYKETSAESNTNISEVFLNITESLLGKVAGGTIAPPSIGGAPAPVAIVGGAGGGGGRPKACDC